MTTRATGVLAALLVVGALGVIAFGLARRGEDAPSIASLLGATDSAPVLPKTQIDAARAETALARARVAQAEAALEEARAQLARGEEHLRKLTDPPGDPELFRKVQRRMLEAPELERLAIAVEVNDGIVTLRGDVPDAESAEIAATLARQTPGVADLDNQLRIAD